MPISSEFVALCRGQIGLLTHSLGASLSVVYLTQELAEGVEARLVPIMAYPETAADWRMQGGLRSLVAGIDTVLSPPLQTVDPGLSAKALPNINSSDAAIDASALSPEDMAQPIADAGAHSDVEAGSNSNAGHASLLPDCRVVLPLMHEDVVLGLLVTERHDRPWTDWEQSQIHHIADTLAIACVLDQRYQWLEREQQQQQQLQAQRHDQLDNLLHQFRNSLMALQTFGKLILKRLLPGDANHDVATSLVRETARLRDLAQQLETAVAGAAAINTVPLSLPPASGDGPLEWRQIDPGGVLQNAHVPALLPAAGSSAGTSLPLESCSITTVLEPLVASARAIAAERSLTLHTDIADDLPPIWANGQVLREVLSNAIDNALKYTPAGGHVLIQVQLEDAIGQGAGSGSEAPPVHHTLSPRDATGTINGNCRSTLTPDAAGAAKDEDFGERQASALERQEQTLAQNSMLPRNEPRLERSFLNIAVTDTGPGIPPQDLPHVFERRYRGVQTQTGVPGSGLGLSIAHDLVLQMQGKIQVLSPALMQNRDGSLDQIRNAQGPGTTVVVGLPIAATE